MNRPDKPIEDFFLDSLLKISFGSVVIITIADYYFTQLVELRSVIVNFSIMFAIILAFTLYKLNYFLMAVLVTAFIVLIAMFYQSIKADSITTSSMAVVMVVGFGFSVLLKGKLPWIFHFLTIAGMMAVFTWLAMHPQRYSKPNAGDIIVAGVTYVVLYMVVSYSSWRLKRRYDDMLATLESKNFELVEKSNEIETQNEELIQSQENLFQLNSHLENIVHDRTHEIQKQNEQLIQYSYSNAHHVRGPLARVLGLIQLSRMDAQIDYPELFQKIEEQAKEIDEVVKQINKELQK